MADSQAPYTYSPLVLRELETHLSSKRFSAYLNRAGHRHEYAVQLYLYNARLAKSLLFPLHMLEVTLRNGIDETLSSCFSPDWHNNQRLLNLLSLESNNSLQKAVRRFKQTPCKDDVISELSLDFWSNLFRPEYDRPLWQRNMRTLFPEGGFTRASFQPEIVKINRLRNRIAHHEPILDLNTSETHSQILTIIDARSKTVGRWTKAHSTFPFMMRTKPGIDSGTGPTLAERADPDFETVCLSDSLETLAHKSSRFFVCLNEEDVPVAICSRSEIGTYILNQIKNGPVDASAHTLKHIQQSQALEHAFTLANGNESLKQLPALFARQTRYVAVLDETPNIRITGVIARSHRRY